MISTFAQLAARATKQGDCLCYPVYKHHRYGEVWLGTEKGRMNAHRAAWELANQMPVPEGFCVCHTCDTPSCINPDHLWLGTKADNTHDMMRKGRCGTLGERSALHKLTEGQVRAILVRLNKEQPESLASEYGVSRVTIERIRARKTWKHLQESA